MNPKESIKSNQALNKRPLAGGLISQEMAAPLMGIFVISIIGGIFGVPIKWCIGFFLWAGTGWLIFAGKKPYLQIAKLFKKTPNWVSARIQYEPRENIPLRKNDLY